MLRLCLALDSHDLITALPQVICHLEEVIGIIVRNEAREEIGRFDVYGAILTRYAGPSFNAMDSAIAVEEIEIAYDYFEYKPAGGKGA